MNRKGLSLILILAGVAVLLISNTGKVYTNLTKAGIQEDSVKNSQDSGGTAGLVPTVGTGGLVSLNFDDGFVSAYRNALPILNKAGLKSTHYIITQNIGEPLYVNRYQILLMRAGGHEIGAHTQTHMQLSQLTEEQVRQEILGSKRDLENIGIKVDTLSYPYGEYNNLVKKVVVEGGFAVARATHPGLNDSSSDRYALKRYNVDASTTFEQVRGWIDEATANGKWLILVFHRVNEEGNSISVDHSLVQQITDYLVEQKVKVVTVSEGAKLTFKPAP